MARGVNKVILVGNLGADPTTAFTGGGSPVCTLSLATTESWKDKQSGEKKESTEWHRVKVFGKLAEICQEYLSKGRQVYIEGTLRTSKYTKDGIERYSTDIIARDMQMLGSGGGGGGGEGGGYAPSRGAPAPQARGPAPSAPAPASSGSANAGFEDDDIPF